MEEAVSRFAHVRRYASPLGDMLMASDGGAITGLWFEGQRRFPSELRQNAESSLPVFDEAVRWLDAYFSGAQPGKPPLLAPQGTPFQQDVWKVLLSIPYGKMITYGEIARRLAQQRGLASMSAQAVGGAVGRNPVSLMIPCHRVVGADGSLTGYAGGTARKKALLAMEAARPNV